MSELMAAGLELTLLGMGVVFVLLTLLVFVLAVMSRLAHYLEGPPAEPPSPAATDDGTTAAIAAAVHTYRARHKRR